MILANLGPIEHFEIADCPGRHQPGTGEINYRLVLDAIERAGFDGWVCPEYLPLGGTEASLDWLGDWGYWANTLFAVHKELQTARVPLQESA